MTGKRFILAEIGQWVSAGMVLAGIVCEYVLKADIFYLLITCGALFWGVSQKVKHPSKLEGDK